MTPVESIRDALEAHGCTPKQEAHGYSARCPAHEDNRASLTLGPGEDGRALVKCHAGCEFADIMKALDLKPADAFPPKEKRGRGRIVATYPYVDERGELLFEVARFDPKDFRQRRPDGNGGYDWSLKGVRRVLYRLPELLKAKAEGRTIYIVEGEKDVDSLRSLGFVATCNPMGAGKWRREYTEQIAGAKLVVIIPDKDAPGQKHAADVARAIEGQVGEVRVLELPGAGKDASDWIAAGGTAVELEAHVESAPQPRLEAQVEEPDFVPTSEPPPADAPHFVIVRNGRTYAGHVEIVEAPEFHTMVCGGKKPEFNVMAGRPELGREPIEDHHVNRIRQLVPRYFATTKEKNGELLSTPFEPNRDDLWAALDQVAHANPYHPVQEYLRRREWDKVSRLDLAARDLLGIASPTPIVRTMVRKWFIGTAARAMRPGCKNDTSLILVGKQGIKKTSFFERLAGRPEWYLSFEGDYEQRDSLQLLAATWIVEFAELESLRGREITSFKAFSTRTTDRWVGKWQRAPTSVPRTFVIVGTTNDETFLDDPTGSRRFWPIAAASIKLDLVDAWRDQLWAEARAAFEKGEPWWLDSEGEADLRKAQEQFEVRDAWEPRILDWTAKVLRGEVEGPITVSAILENALLKQPGQWTKGDAQRVSVVLRRMGWRRRRETVGDARPWVWHRKGGTVEEVGQGVSRENR